MTYKAGESFSELPGDRHNVSANASKTKPAKLLAVFVVDANETELTIPFGNEELCRRMRKLPCEDLLKLEARKCREQTPEIDHGPTVLAVHSPLMAQVGSCEVSVRRPLTGANGTCCAPSESTKSADFSENLAGTGWR